MNYCIILFFCIFIAERKDSGLAASFQDVVGKLNKSEVNVVEENLAELQRAVQVIESGTDNSERS